MLDLLIISGASKGIGASIVSKCASICKKMIVISSSDAIFNVKHDVCDIIPLKLDLTKYNDVYDSVKNTISNLENINSLGIVLCGAQLGEYGGLFSSDLNNWEMLYKCNVLGNLSIIKGCSKIIESGVKTRIVMFSGGGAAFGVSDFVGYSLSKVASVRAAENLSLELRKINENAYVIIISPGAILTDMLKKVIEHGAEVRTKTDISEPTNFVYSFLTDDFPSQELNGKFLHVRDEIKNIDFKYSNPDIFKLRRTQ